MENIPNDPIDDRFRTEQLASIKVRDFYFHALRSLVVLSFPQLLSFSLVFPKPLSETLKELGREDSR
jgi:hypothetical protein